MSQAPQASYVLDQTLCYHCGEVCPEPPLKLEEKRFCCEGCKVVYELLQENGLCNYYELDRQAGRKIKTPQHLRFQFLDNPDIAQKLLDFAEGNQAKVRLRLPAIHCSSCIWLLENLHKLKAGISHSRVDFIKKEISIAYDSSQVSLRGIAELLEAVGYAPDISLADYQQKEQQKKDRSLSYKIGIAGFCAGNIMMLSFPEYLGIDQLQDQEFYRLFGFINLLLSLPVVWYAASDYFISAYTGLKHQVLNLDVPISLGIAAVFLRSAYEVISHTGAGYFDSLTGLIFFLLIGKWFQHKTFSKFSFERDYLSYFPVAVTVLHEEKESSIPLSELKPGTRILIRNNELIPADAILEEGEACIDYSFVTGEALPVIKRQGELIYAGGRQTGQAIQLRVEKEVSQSYLLQLWNNEVFKKKDDAYLATFILSFSKYFTYGTLAAAALTFTYWMLEDSSKALFAVTSVLLVACPCALALSLPFALSNVLRLLGRKGLYLKSADTVEQLAGIDTIVFDKTGTLTEAHAAEIRYEGQTLTTEELQGVRSALRQSSHPYSRALYEHLDVPTYQVSAFAETAGEGLVCRVNKHEIKIGSRRYAAGMTGSDAFNESRVYLTIDEQFKGYYTIQNLYRTGSEHLLQALQQEGITLHLLSGDKDGEKHRLLPYFKEERFLHFNQKPADKLQYIERLKQEGKNVLMLGDGLNDAGALKAGGIGIAVSDDTHHFTPACDGILEGKNLSRLLEYIRFSRAGIQAIRYSLVLSLMYNAAGLFYAVQGLLSPLVAAILMPMSSVTVVAFVVLYTNRAARKILSA